MLHVKSNYFDNSLSGLWLKPWALLAYPLAEANGNEAVFSSLPSILNGEILTEVNSYNEGLFYFIAVGFNRRKINKEERGFSQN